MLENLKSNQKWMDDISRRKDKVDKEAELDEKVGVLVEVERRTKGYARRKESNKLVVRENFSCIPSKLLGCRGYSLIHE